ncbi:MAG: hypothetical protein ACKVP2_06895 [Burkholderiales bacterium]
MRNTFRALVSLLMMVWLPFNGYAAVVMPFCQHGGADMIADGSAPSGKHAGMTHQGHANADAAHGADHSGLADDAGSGLACNDCGVCHLACSPLLVSEFVKFEPACIEKFSVRKHLPLPSFSPEQPLHPPKTALSSSAG